MVELQQRALELSVWDRDRLSSNDFMGGVRFSLGKGVFIINDIVINMIAKYVNFDTYYKYIQGAAKI